MTIRRPNWVKKRRKMARVWSLLVKEEGEVVMLRAEETMVVDDDDKSVSWSAILLRLGCAFLLEIPPMS